jgi:anti-sigma-K factor RskA
VLADAPTQSFAASLEIRSLLTEGATLAISLEPHGGSATGLPTGPVIMSGQLGKTDRS